MSEAGDYNPSGWAGHDFNSARASYRTYVDDSYSQARSKGVTVKDVLPTSITTDSSCPVVGVVDQTGSMGDWPATIFSKLPYLEHEAKTEYRGEDVEFSFGAFGDARNHERYPVQARPFASGKDLKTRLAELVHERNGGGQMHETSELELLYYARNCHMSKAIQDPLLILVTDEMPYDSVSPDLAELAHVKLEKTISVEQIIREVQKKFALYIVLKPYNENSGDRNSENTEIRRTWAKLVGEDHIAPLSEAGRVVDVIFGIMAKEANKVAYFQKELEDRQTPQQVKTVMTSLKTIHALPKGGHTSGHTKKLLGDGRSVTRRTKSND